MRNLLYIAGLAMAMVACSSVDCPLNNTVYAKYKLGGDITTLDDTLSVTTRRANGTDTTLLNMLAAADSFSLPVSYGQTIDEICLVRKSGAKEKRDTIWMEKTNEPHFESVDCGVNYFHTITNIRHTTHYLDSVKITNRNISYDANKAHIYIYYRE